jgi:hypothetical protein
MVIFFLFLLYPLLRLQIANVLVDWIDNKCKTKYSGVVYIDMDTLMSSHMHCDVIYKERIM